LAVVAVVAPLAFGACSDDDSTTTEAADESSTTSSAAVVNTGPTVEVEGLSFAPSVENVVVGDTVTWSNTGDSRHTVTPEPLPDGSDPWTSTPLDPGQTFVQTFNTAGTYQYFCSIHPDRMTGSVVVAPA
jgi:plastocyanin